MYGTRPVEFETLKQPIPLAISYLIFKTFWSEQTVVFHLVQNYHVLKRRTKKKNNTRDGAFSRRTLRRDYHY